MEPVQLGAAQQSSKSSKASSSPSKQGSSSASSLDAARGTASTLSRLSKGLAIHFTRSRLSLRFVNPVVEDAFLKSRLRRMRIGLIAHMCITGFIDIGFAILYTTQGNLNWLFKYWSLFLAPLLAINCPLVVSMVAMLPITKVCVRQERAYECAGLMMAALGSAITLSMGWHTFMDEWKDKQGQYGKIVVCISVITVFTHTVLSVRWPLMVIIDAGVCVGIVIVLGGDAAGRMIGFLAILVVISCSSGLYMLEDVQRNLFTAVLDEKKLRVQAEFRANPQPSAGLRSEQSCGASTTETGKMFNEFTNSSLLDLVAMGKKEQWLIGDDKVSIFENQVLGRGALGVTVVGRMDRSEVAVKVYKKGICGELNDMVMNELRILRHVRHPNIVLFHGAHVDVDCGEVSLVMEKVVGKSYVTCVNEMASWTPQSSCHAGQTRVLRLVAEALCHLHTHSPVIVHGDLKPSNILVEDRAEGPLPKLMDFGLASISRRRVVKGGTLGWSAPEVWQGGMQRQVMPGGTVCQVVSPSMDVYSFALLAFFTLAGEVIPPAKQQSFEMVQEVLDFSDRMSPMMATWRPMIRQSLSWSPAERPTMLDVYDRLFHCSQAEGYAVPWKHAFQGKAPSVRRARLAPERKAGSPAEFDWPDKCSL